MLYGCLLIEKHCFTLLRCVTLISFYTVRAEFAALCLGGTSKTPACTEFQFRMPAVSGMMHSRRGEHSETSVGSILGESQGVFSDNWRALARCCEGISFSWARPYHRGLPTKVNLTCRDTLALNCYWYIFGLYKGFGKVKTAVVHRTRALNKPRGILLSELAWSIGERAVSWKD